VDSLDRAAVVAVAPAVVAGMAGATADAVARVAAGAIASRMKIIASPRVNRVSRAGRNVFRDGALIFRRFASRVIERDHGGTDGDGSRHASL
jgi:hypothetical protein